MRLVHLIPLLALLVPGGTRSEGDETGPAAVNAPILTVYAIWDGISQASEPMIRQQMDALIREFGPGNAYYRPGFAFIYADQRQTELIARLAREKHLSLGLIAAIQTHTGGQSAIDYFAQDLRSYQWRMKNNNWQGYYTGKNNAAHLEVGEDGRDHCVPSPSRYSPLTQERYLGRAHADGREIHQIITDNPGVITVVNGVIEEELAVAAASIQGADANDYLADYSPFAITEFRDWLRHTGIYDDVNGKFAHQGAPEAIVGNFMMIDGALRSRFYDDPNPGDGNGTGSSFNQTFGTNFSTWDLKYWDIKRFPGPITDPAFQPMPSEGQPGFIPDGFDAPRQVKTLSKWWRAWSWDYADQGGSYPSGNPTHPAFGFRQCLVQHFVQDVFNAFAAEGVPRNVMYAHQIPGEQVGMARCRSSASPVWTGYLPASGTVGVTCFGWFNPQRALQYSDLTSSNGGWGIFEWHPRPNSTRDDPMLYDAAMKELIVYSRSGCRHLFAGWWSLQGSKADPKQTFWLNGSMFSKAIKTFLATTPGNPPPEPPALPPMVGTIR